MVDFSRGSQDAFVAVLTCLYTKIPGTPVGVGFARDPPVWLKAGDVMEVTLEALCSWTLAQTKIETDDCRHNSPCDHQLDIFQTYFAAKGKPFLALLGFLAFPLRGFLFFVYVFPLYQGLEGLGSDSNSLFLFLVS